MSISSASPCEIGSTSHTISSVPILSFSSIANLSDTLKELPFVRPIDKRLLDLDTDINFDSLSLIDNCYRDHSIKLINNTENSFIESISSLIKQVDTSKIEFIHHHERINNPFPPLLKSLIKNDRSIFSNTFSDVQFIEESHKEDDESKESPKAVKIESKPKVEKESINTTSFYKKTNKNLPDDFTPELIEQLAAEGYDVMGSRRARAPKATVKVESSDSEDELKLKKKNPDKTLSKMMPVRQKRELDQPNEHHSLKRFSQLLEDLLDSFENDLQQMITNKDLDQDIPSEYLISRPLCAEMAQEAFKMYTYSSINLVGKENLLKLQNLIFFNIKDGIRSLHIMNEESGEEKLLKDILIDKVVRASDCSILSLIIMTSDKISKELIIEDLIEQIGIFQKLILTEIIFPHYDPVYKSSSSSSDSKPVSKRKLFTQSNNKTTLNSKHINHVYNRMREMLGFTSHLLAQIDLTDTILITLTSLSVMCFFVENINDLQLEALKILTNIFSRYERHRQLVLDDILSSLAKLHQSKRTSRSYKCFSGDSIQMFSALLLQLVQSEVNSLDESRADNSELTFEHKETFLLNTYEQANHTAKKFLTHFFSKCKVKQADFDFRPLFENFIQDLLVTANKPEWPVSQILLNLLGLILVNQIQSEQVDVPSRVNSLEYLGIIVSQLRKDALEYQKYPGRIDKILDKLAIKKPQVSDTDTFFVLQSSLVAYLNGLIVNDQLHKYAKNFLLAQWLKEVNVPVGGSEHMEHGEERVDAVNTQNELRHKIYSLLDNQSPSTSLDAGEAFFLTKYLASANKNVDKNFDFYLLNIVNLTGSDGATPTQVRSKAIKCLSLVIEADPHILLKPKVYKCVEANFLHQTISVREASVDLVGRFITIMPELTAHYYKLLSERILDVGVSVRKRVIKILRDICLNQPRFEHKREICVRILRRINDEDNIKKLVIDTFYQIWFAPCDKQQRFERVQNLVQVVNEFNVISNPTSMDIFESLFAALIVTQTVSSDDTTTSASAISKDSGEKELLLNRSKEVERSCKQIVDCLIDNVLSTEANSNTSQLVSSLATLYLLSKIKPDYLVAHAETLLPYLNIKSTSPTDSLIINSAARILECVVPLLQSPSNSFLLALEESLCKLIFQSGMMIVSSCISCLGTVVNKLSHNFKLAADCLSKFYKNAVYLRESVKADQRIDPQAKSMLHRVLYTLGLLSKHFDLDSPQFKQFNVCSKDSLFDLFMHFVKATFDSDVQLKALLGLGFFLTTNSEYMIREEVKCLYLTCIKSDEARVPFALKAQVFANLTEYLNEEDQRNLAKSVQLAKSHCKDDLKEMLDVQSGMASTIVQCYLRPILDSYLTSNVQVRLSVFTCLSMILNQGLVYPIECVPYLVAMTTDIDSKIQTKSLLHLTNLQKAHPNFVQSKSIAGVNVSFVLHKCVRSSASVVRGFSENGEVLSLNHHLYSLIRSNRSYRRAFVQQLLKMFDDSSTSSHTTLEHKVFIADNLAYFPYQLLDEPLFLIHQIDLIISCTGINLLQTFKENLSDKSDGEAVSKESGGGASVPNDFDMLSQLECPQEVEEVRAAAKAPQIEDEDEQTFESVYQNLPGDLSALKQCMYQAQGCCLLLILKLFLKEVYTINDSRIQSYSPCDSAKVNDRPLTSRKANRKFNPKQIIDYIGRYTNDALQNEKLKESLVNEFLEFKELMLTIDQEEAAKTDETKVIKPGSEPKLSLLQQKLYEGIEKTRSVTSTPGGNASGQDSVNATPRKSKHKRGLSSSTKKLSSKKRKKKRDSDDSSNDEFMANSDLDDEL